MEDKVQILDGKTLSVTIQRELADEVDVMIAAGERPPHLAAVIVGANPASKVYVGHKIKACERVGYKSSLIEFPESITQEDLIAEIQKMNADDDIDGYIVQLPLPRHIDNDAIIQSVNPKKDVDGFHPVNIGKMTMGIDTFVPATPFGIITLLDRYNISTEGKSVVVLGRSNIVGTPMSILLSRNAKVGNATVTLTHSRTKNLEELLRNADIIVAAIGRDRFVKEHMVKSGAVIIDVGINSIPDATKKRGYRLVGDVDFDSVAEKCSFITPVPGGVGPLTVAALMMNTLKAAKLYRK